jgi:hypothetical protein
LCVAALKTGEERKYEEEEKKRDRGRELERVRESV